MIGYATNPTSLEPADFDIEPVVERLVSSPSFQADMEGDGETDVEAYARDAIERALSRHMPLSALVDLYGGAA